MSERVRFLDLRAVLSLAVLLGVASAMLSVSWLRWPDLFVDFGEELYVPWQLTEGRVLYRDVSFARGPLSPYVNFALFRLVGPSFLALSGLNIALSLFLAGLIHHFFRLRGGYLSATLTAAAFLLLFAFPQYGFLGNFNYVSPYSHEQTHGVIAGVFSIVAIDRYLRSSRVRWLLAASMATGLTFLTKPDIFVSTAAAILGALVLARIQLDRPRSSVAVVALAGASFLLPIAFFFGMLWRNLAAGEALKGIFQGWLVAVEAIDIIASSPIAKGILGVDDLAGNLCQAAFQLAAYVGAFALAWGVSRVPLPTRHRRAWTTAVYAVTVAVTLLLLPEAESPTVPPSGSFVSIRALPLALLAYLGWLVWRSRRGEHRQQCLDVGTFAFGVFALGIMARMAFNPTIYYYGFSMAMPVTILFVHLAVVEGGAAAERTGGRRGIYLAVVLGLLTCFVSVYVRSSVETYRLKDYVVGSTFKTYGKYRMAHQVTRALEWIDAEMEPHDTFSVFPEGIMLNFLSGHASPVPISSFIPPTFGRFGEKAVIRTLAANPPDYVLLLHRPTPEHGANFFGRDYAVRTAAWIRERYTPAVTFGRRPLTPGGTGVTILRRNARQKEIEQLDPVRSP